MHVITPTLYVLFKEIQHDYKEIIINSVWLSDKIVIQPFSNARQVFTMNEVDSMHVILAVYDTKWKWLNDACSRYKDIR